MRDHSVRNGEKPADGTEQLWNESHSEAVRGRLAVVRIRQEAASNHHPGKKPPGGNLRDSADPVEKSLGLRRMSGNGPEKPIETG
jgi:hypothetical protein